MALRERQVELTRDLILDGVGSLIREDRLGDFSMQDVADRAGVSLRTVYRHFASRDELLDGFFAWANGRMRSTGGMDPPRKVDDIASQVRVKFAALEREAPLLIPLMKLDSAYRTYRRQAGEYVDGMRSALADVTAHLDPEMAEAVTWTIRMICAGQSWRMIREQSGLDSAHAGAAAAWAVEVLIEALREGRGPTIEEGGRQ